MSDLDDSTLRALAIPPDILDVDEDEMRRLGYWVVDRVIEHITTLGGQRAISEADYATLQRELGGPVPRGLSAIEEHLATLADVAGTNQQHGDHPRYFARVPGPSSHPAILGEWLATGMQSIAASWSGGSGPSALELIVCDWLKVALGLPTSCEGVLLSGGSMANITGIITARQMSGDGVVYLTDQTHASIHRGLPAIGQPVDGIRVLDSDEAYRLSPDALGAAIDADLAGGRRPMMVIATVGSTNTGAVDDLPAIADLCSRHGLWLHVDGAYGGPAALCERGRHVMPGLERADSFVIDPHKWLFQPYDVACLFVTAPGALEHTFAIHPEYLADVTGRAVDLRNRSLELTRRGRAFKLWLTIRAYGLDTLAQAVHRGIALAEYAQHVIEEHEHLEIVTPAQLGIVTFAGRQADDADHSRAVAQLTADGYGAASSTVLKGRTALRLCTINPRTTTQDIHGTIGRLADYLTIP